MMIMRRPSLTEGAWPPRRSASVRPVEHARLQRTRILDSELRFVRRFDEVAQVHRGTRRRQHITVIKRSAAPLSYTVAQPPRAPSYGAGPAFPVVEAPP